MTFLEHPTAISPFILSVGVGVFSPTNTEFARIPGDGIRSEKYQSAETACALEWGGEWLLIAVAAFELLVSVKHRATGGSIPPGSEGQMNSFHNAKLLCGSMFTCCQMATSSWVGRASLLSLGVWCASPCPNAHPVSIAD